MTAVGTEGETDEIALMGGVREAGIGKIAELVGGEIKNGDRLMGLGPLRAVTIIQQRRDNGRPDSKRWSRENCSPRQSGRAKASSAPCWWAGEFVLVGLNPERQAKKEKLRAGR